MSRIFRDWDLDRLVDRVTREISREISRFMESAVSPFRFATYISPEGYRRPISEAYLDGDEVVMVVELPGASRDVIDLRVRGEEVEVTAGFSEELRDKASRYSVFKAKGYRALIPLPKQVKAEEAKAIFRDGLLIVRIPVEKPRGIAVKVE